MNKNMELIEKEIIRLKALKHKSESEMTPEELMTFKLMGNFPNCISMPFFSPLGEKLDNSIGILLFSKERHIGLETIDKFRISTVWLGTDHSFKKWFPETNDDLPIIFETMIFYDSDEKNPFEDYQERYSTIEQAEEGHAKAVEMVKKYVKG